jgi:hypothetical protein
MVAPTLDKLAKEWLVNCWSLKVNTDENPQWAHAVRRAGYSDYVVCRRWKNRSPPGGALPEARLRDVINQFLEVVNGS